MGLTLLCHIKPAERGNSLRSGLAIDGQAMLLLESLDLRAGAAEVVPVLRIETGKAVLHEELLQLADVIADAAVLQHAGEDESSPALRYLLLRPEGRPAVSVPRVAGKGQLHNASVAASRFDHVQLGIDDIADMGCVAVLIELENEITHAEPVLRELFALVVHAVSGEIVAEQPLHVLQPVHAETRAVECAEHIAEARGYLLPPERDSSVRVCLRGLRLTDPALVHSGAELSLGSPDVNGMGVCLLLQVGNETCIFRVRSRLHKICRMNVFLYLDRGLTCT